MESSADESHLNTIWVKSAQQVYGGRLFGVWA